MIEEVNYLAVMAACEWKDRQNRKGCGALKVAHGKLILGNNEVCEDCLADRSYQNQREHVVSKKHVASCFDVTPKELELALKLVLAEAA